MCLLRHRRFTFSFVGRPEDVGMATGATIHTANGLATKIARRVSSAPAAQESELETVTAA